MSERAVNVFRADEAVKSDRLLLADKGSTGIHTAHDSALGSSLHGERGPRTWPDTLSVS